ncbi:MAG: hypothetical protein ABSC93_02395 [Bryobacteraceae bacterium]
MGDAGGIVFSILHATARVPDGWQEAWIEWSRNWDGTPAEWLVAVEERDWESVKQFWKGDWAGMTKGRIPVRTVLQAGISGSAVANWNTAARFSVGGVLIMGADDFMAPPHWDTELLRVMGSCNEREFVIHVNTNSSRDNELMSHVFMSRAVFERWGYFLYPGYTQMFCDDDATAHAKAEKLVIRAPHLVFEHQHFTLGKRARDAVYAHGNRPQAFQEGNAIFLRRRKGGFVD